MNKTDILELRRKRDGLVQTAKNILGKAQDEQRTLTSDENKDLRGLEDKVDGLNNTINRAEEINNLTADFDKSIRPPGVSANASRDALMLGETRAYRRDERISTPYNGPGLGALVRGIALGDWSRADELRTMAIGTGSLGGFMVPDPLSRRIIDKMRNKAQVINAGAITVPMDSATLKLARVSGDPTAYFKAENAPITASDMGFEAVTLSACTLVSLVKLSVELLEDAANIDQVVESAMAQALALKLDYAALYGDGSPNTPLGIRNQTGVQVVSLGDNGGHLTYADFSSAYGKLLAENFTGPFSAIYSPRETGHIDGYSDSTGQPLQPPPSFAAMSKFVSSQVPINLTKGTAHNASDAFVGQFDNCVIGMRTQLTIETSRHAADASNSAFGNLQVWVRGYLRADVALLHPEAFVVLNGIIP